MSIKRCAYCGKKPARPYTNLNKKKKVAFTIHLCNNCGDIGIKQSTNTHKIYKS